MTDLDLLPGTLNMLILRALCQGPQHGYHIARFLREQSRGKFRIIDGALYASLHRLEQQGSVTTQWGQSDSGKRAKFYELTPAGLQELRLESARWLRYISAVSRVMSVRPLPLTLLPPPASATVRQALAGRFARQAADDAAWSRRDQRFGPISEARRRVPLAPRRAGGVRRDQTGRPPDAPAPSDQAD